MGSAMSADASSDYDSSPANPTDTVAMPKVAANLDVPLQRVVTVSSPASLLVRSCLRIPSRKPRQRGLHVHWGNVSAREFARRVGGSGGVPEHSRGEWALGLSNRIVVRTADGEPTKLGADDKDVDGDDDNDDDGCDDDIAALLEDGTAAQRASPLGGLSPMLRGHHHQPQHRRTGASGGRRRGAGGGVAYQSPRLQALTARHTPVVASRAAAADTELPDDLFALPPPAGTPSRARRAVATTAGIVDLGTVDEFEARRTAELVARTEQLPLRLRSLANGETRQWSHRSGASNPLFTYVDERSRFAIFKRDAIDAGDAAALTARNESVAAVLDAITASRAAGGCNCHVLDARDVRKWPLKRLHVELEARGLSPPNASSDRLTSPSLSSEHPTDTAEVAHDGTAHERSAMTAALVAWSAAHGVCNSTSRAHSRDGPPAKEDALAVAVDSALRDVQQMTPYCAVLQPLPTAAISNGTHILFDAVIAAARGSSLAATVAADNSEFFDTSSKALDATATNKAPSVSADSTGTTTCPCVAAGVGCHYAACGAHHVSGSSSSSSSAPKDKPRSCFQGCNNYDLTGAEGSYAYDAETVTSYRTVVLSMVVAAKSADSAASRGYFVEREGDATAALLALWQQRKAEARAAAAAAEAKAEARAKAVRAAAIAAAEAAAVVAAAEAEAEAAAHATLMKQASEAADAARRAAEFQVVAVEVGVGTDAGSEESHADDMAVQEAQNYSTSTSDNQSGNAVDAVAALLAPFATPPRNIRTTTRSAGCTGASPFVLSFTPDVDDHQPSTTISVPSPLNVHVDASRSRRQAPPRVASRVSRRQVPGSQQDVPRTPTAPASVTDQNVLAVDGTPQSVAEEGRQHHARHSRGGMTHSPGQRKSRRAANAANPRSPGAQSALMPVISVAQRSPAVIQIVKPTSGARGVVAREITITRREN